MFFSYSSSSITLIDIVLLEQRRRNRDSRVRGEKGGGETGSRTGEGEGGRGGGWKEQEKGAVDRKQWFWWHSLEGQHSQKQRAGANGPSLPQDGHGPQSTGSLQVPSSLARPEVKAGHDTAWTNLPQRCLGKTCPFPKTCGIQQPLDSLHTLCRHQHREPAQTKPLKARHTAQAWAWKRLCLPRLSSP